LDIGFKHELLCQHLLIFRMTHLPFREEVVEVAIPNDLRREFEKLDELLLFRITFVQELFDLAISERMKR
jgi:hypothetical protein